MGQGSAEISSGNLPVGQAVPSERSRAIAEFQKAQFSSLARPVKPNLPIFHCVESPTSISRKEAYTNLSDTDSASSRSSRTVSPEGYPATPPSRTEKVSPTLGTTPSRRYTETSYSEKFSAEEPVTPSKSFKNSYKRGPTKSVASLCSEQFSTLAPITPPRSAQNLLKRASTKSGPTSYSEKFGVRPVTPPRHVQKTYQGSQTKPAKGVYSETLSAQPIADFRSIENTYKQTPIRHAVPGFRRSKENNSRTIDLNAPEPSPLFKIQQFQYTPPAQSNKRREGKKVLPVPFQLSYRNN
ncbi:hypothetical protein EYC84_008361 [Monilinia fructicola]|nr:hypothetical protein EYC84_008361 [Monilinia fructicola]